MMGKIRMLKTIFVLTGDSINPAECTRIIGINPTESNYKGEKVKEILPPKQIGEWSIETEWIELEDTNYGIDLVMDIIWPHRDAILEVARKELLTTTIVSAIRIYDERPVYYVSKQNIYRIGTCQHE